MTDPIGTAWAIASLALAAFLTVQFSPVVSLRAEARTCAAFALGDVCALARLTTTESRP